MNGVDPEAYLRDVLGRIADHPINRIDDAAAMEHRPTRRRSTTSSLSMASKVQRIKALLLACLNLVGLVECVAYIGAQLQSK